MPAGRSPSAKPSVFDRRRNRVHHEILHSRNHPEAWQPVTGGFFMLLAGGAWVKRRLSSCREGVEDRKREGSKDCQSSGTKSLTTSNATSVLSKKGPPQ